MCTALGSFQGSFCTLSSGWHSGSALSCLDLTTRAEPGTGMPSKLQSSAVRTAFPWPGNPACCARSSLRPLPCRVSGPLSNWERERALRGAHRSPGMCMIPETLPEEATPPAFTHRAPHIWRSFQAHVGVKVRRGCRRVALEGAWRACRGRRAPRVQVLVMAERPPWCPGHARPSAQRPHPEARSSLTNLLSATVCFPPNQNILFTRCHFD